MPKKKISRKAAVSAKKSLSKPVKNSVAIDAKQIIQWLENEPDFFIQHPAALANLELPDNTGAAISLHQYQVRVLREEKSQLMQKLTALVKNAKTNHKINADLLDLAGHMIGLGKQNAGMPVYLKAIENHFSLFSVRYVDIAQSAEQFKLIKTLMGKQDSYCSNKNELGMLEVLYGKDAPAVLSLAMVAVKDSKNHLGYLTLAADDADRFTPQMGDAFLLMLARLIASAGAATDTNPKNAA